MAIDLEKLEDSSHLLNILLQLEDILDSLDCYVYRNWIHGEVIEGPIIKRHWISFSLLYPHDRMPDPRASLRLMKHGLKVEFQKVQENGKDFHPLVDDKADPTRLVGETEKTPKQWFWMIKITVPRRLLDEIETDTDFYEDEVDMDDVNAAKDSGIDNETAYNSDQNDQQNNEFFDNEE